MNHVYITVDTDEDGTEIVSCQICGGLWQINVCPAHSTKECAPYASALDGSPATLCPDKFDQCHHYADECATLPFTGTCSLDPDCNCLYCRS